MGTWAALPARGQISIGIERVVGHPAGVGWQPFQVTWKEDESTMATTWSKFKEEQSTVAQGESFSTKRRRYATRPQKYKRTQQARNVPLAGQERRGCGHGRWPRRPRDTGLLLLLPQKELVCWTFRGEACRRWQRPALGQTIRLKSYNSYDNSKTATIIGENHHFFPPGSLRKEGGGNGFERLHDTKKAKWNSGRSVEAKMPLCSVAGEFKIRILTNSTKTRRREKERERDILSCVLHLALKFYCSVRVCQVRLLKKKKKYSCLSQLWPVDL